jgi:UDP-galactopyranose mutase
MKQYDYLIIGSGLYSSTFTCFYYIITEERRKCLVINRCSRLDDSLCCEN